MRILAACSEGIGRYLPFVPFLDQVRRNGGQTLVVAPSSLQGAVEKTGHPFTRSLIRDVGESGSRLRPVSGEAAVDECRLVLDFPQAVLDELEQMGEAVEGQNGLPDIESLA